MKNRMIAAVSLPKESVKKNGFMGHLGGQLEKLEVVNAFKNGGIENLLGSPRLHQFLVQANQ